MVCYSGRLISLMSHCDVYHRLCYISNIYEGLCHIVMFINVDVSLWCYRGLYLITMLSHGLFINVGVSLWCYRGLYRITMLSHGLFIDVDVSLWCYRGLYRLVMLSHGLLQCLVGICQHNQRFDTLIMW